MAVRELLQTLLLICKKSLTYKADNTACFSLAISKYLTNWI